MDTKDKLNIVLWSGGKDSTATIILCHLLGVRIDLIITSLVWFDKKRGMYGDHPKKIEWMLNYAKPIFEAWGFPVKTVSSDKDYIYQFYKVVKKSKNPELVGKHYGFLIGGFCKMQDQKVSPVKRYLRDNFTKKKVEYTEICGICADEEERLSRMIARGQRSVLAEQGYTQADAYHLCKEHELLAPGYVDGGRMRDGCWFCPNQKVKELAQLKVNYPELWLELKKMSEVKNTVARGFQYGVPFDEVEAKVNAYIANPPPEQLSLF